MSLKIFQVAAFTEQMFGGNPAAVIPLDEWLDDDVMQKIAAENNLSETAFFVPVAKNEWHIRWFTPAVEVPLCGHATLASAAVLHQKMKQDEWPITLRSASGTLSVDTDGAAYILDFPASKPEPVSVPDGLEKALGCEVLEVLLGRDIYLAVVADEATVAKLQPDFSLLGKLVEHGIAVTAPGVDVDFVSRFFAPAVGLDEDPVTGAAHCVLTPYWSQRLDKKSLKARQISNRVGDLECDDRGDRVLLKGRAVFFLSGSIDQNPA